MSYSGNLIEPLSGLMPSPAIVLEDASLPKHLARLPGGQWSLWRWVALRGAGFPVAQILQLADVECGRAARELIDAEDAAEQVRREVVAQLKRIETDGEDEMRVGARKVLRRIWKGTLPRSEDAPFGSHPLINTLRSAYVQVDAVRASFNQEYAKAVARNSQTIYDLASSDLFQEAVIWQNRKAYHSGVSSILRHPPGTVARNSARRTNEELIATYLQRYCTKNDTIGFFGPVGWARLVSNVIGVEAQPGATLVSKRYVRPESWSIDRITEILNADESLRRWSMPRTLPFFRVEDNTLHHPFSGPVTISDDVAAVVAAADGTRTAEEIATEMIRNPALGLETEEEVFDVLDMLCEEGLVLWGFECPVGEDAEKHLLDLIDRISDDTLRAGALELVRELQAARGRVAAAAGEAKELDQNMAALEETFERLTGEACTRSHGEIYAARTLVYEDCERAFDVEIGPDVLESLGPSLSLLLDSARWFTFELARRYREVFTGTYAELVQETGATTVEAVAFWHRIQPHVVAKDVHVIKSAMTAFQERWASVLSLSDSERRVNYTSEELRPRVRAQFAAPSAGWRLGRYQCPDVMIAANSADAITRGDYQLVMGELHLGANTLANSIFMHQHPRPGDLFEAYETDLPEPCIIPIPPRQWPTLTARTALCLVAPKDYRLAISYDAIGSSTERVLPISAFVIEKSDGRLVAHTHDGAIEIEIIEFFGAVFSLVCAGNFKILAPRKHTPRVTIDRLIVHREAWSFSLSELDFLQQKEEADRFAALQRWVREHGIPRFVFVKAPLEPKPFYVDFESPILINFFAKTVRRHTSNEALADCLITVTEMIPTPDQVWVTDALGQRYTAELRMVGIDRVADCQLPIAD
ncbi:MAG TPA: lantibiotic dehydratase [Pyrinomonadaceae bacterium]|nr:lantibiotic dehydratase [Pyrinomonadaceae bacterium]